MLFTYPCREIVIVPPMMDAREIVERWRACGGKVFEARMIAPTLSPLWKAMGRRSPGVLLRQVEREECVRLGVMTAKEVDAAVPPDPAAEAEAANFTPDFLKAAVDELDIEIAASKARLQRHRDVARNPKLPELREGEKEFL